MSNFTPNLADNVVTKNLELKDTEIKKMDEIIQNYKALLQHLTEEKNILNKENQRLTKENVTTLFTHTTLGERLAHDLTLRTAGTSIRFFSATL